MPMNATTDECVRAVREHLSADRRPAWQRAIIDAIIRTAPEQLPLGLPILGESLIQFTRMLDSVIDAIRLADREQMIDWETTVTTARNILLIAGTRLYTGVEL